MSTSAQSGPAAELANARAIFQNVCENHAIGVELADFEVSVRQSAMEALGRAPRIPVPPELPELLSIHAASYVALAFELGLEAQQTRNCRAYLDHLEVATWLSAGQREALRFVMGLVHRFAAAKAGHG